MNERTLYEDIVDLFKQEGLEIKETSIEELEDHNINSKIDEPEGVFIPRTKNGYFRSVEDTQENKRRYAHELGHGIYCENFELGSRLSELDENVFRFEQIIYGEKPRGDFISVPANINGAYVVDQETAEFIAGEEISSAERYFLVEKELLDEYLDARNELNIFYTKNLNLMEGFSIACESQVVDDLQLDKRPDYQVEGYEKFSELSFQEIINSLD